MKIIKEFTTKTGKKVQLVEPSMDRLDEILRWANVLAKEDTFLTFDPGKDLTHEDEEKWLKVQIEGIEKGRSQLCWAILDNHIVGSVDIHRGCCVRDYHIGSVGVMVDSNLRGEGLGKFLIQTILEKGKDMGIRTAILDVFSNNEIARSLYEKVGFIEYGSLPDGLYRKKEFSDRVYMYKRLL